MVINWLFSSDGNGVKSLVRIGSIADIIHFLNGRSEFGYRLSGYFSNKSSNQENYLGPIDDALEYIIKEGIHELYCSTSELNQKQIKTFIDFAENNLILLN